MNANDLFKQPFIWENREYFLSLLSHLSQVKFALFCAEQVIDLVEEKHKVVCLKAIETAKLFLEGKATREDCRVAADATAYADAYTAAYVAAYVAAAYAAANTAAYAATYVAAYVAADAADADAAVDGGTKQEETKQAQMNFLRELIIGSLSEEDKECWLLVASV